MQWYRAGKASAKRLGKNVDLVQMHWSTANYFPWQEWALLDGLEINTSKVWLRV